MENSRKISLRPLHTKHRSNPSLVFTNKNFTDRHNLIKRSSKIAIKRTRIISSGLPGSSSQVALKPRLNLNIEQRNIPCISLKYKVHQKPLTSERLSIKNAPTHTAAIRDNSFYSALVSKLRMLDVFYANIMVYMSCVNSNQYQNILELDITQMFNSLEFCYNLKCRLSVSPAMKPRNKRSELTSSKIANLNPQNRDTDFSPLQGLSPFPRVATSPIAKIAEIQMAL